MGIVEPFYVIGHACLRIVPGSNKLATNAFGAEASNRRSKQFWPIALSGRTPLSQGSRREWHTPRAWHSGRLCANIATVLGSMLDG